MRALCGAIIAAGAMIGLGLTALGIGTRYEHVWARPDASAAAPTNTEPYMVHLSQMDRPLTFILVFLTSGAVVGLGIAFVGLAYHHERRERELKVVGGPHRIAG
jgi:hypothetical protein